MGCILLVLCIYCVFAISLIAPSHLTPPRWISWGRNVVAAAITSVLEFRLLKSLMPRRLWWPLLTPVAGRWELTTTAKGDTVSVAPRCGETVSAIHRPLVKTNERFVGFLRGEPSEKDHSRKTTVPWIYLCK